MFFVNQTCQKLLSLVEMQDELNRSFICKLGQLHS